MVTETNPAFGAQPQPLAIGGPLGSPQEPFRRRDLVLMSACLCVAYYLGAKLGFMLTFRPHPISVLWPPNALLLAALLLTPARFWWFLLLAALPAHLAAELQSGIPLAMVLAWFVSNCSEALIGAVLVRRFVRGRLRFDSFRHVGIFLICGALLAPLLSSFLDAAFVNLIGWGQQSYWRLWQPRFFSNILAELALVPVIVTWVTGGTAWIRTGSLRRQLELGLLLVLLLTVSILVFDHQRAGPHTTPALFYAPLPFLLWAAVRLGPPGTSLSFLLVVFLATWGAVNGHGPFITSSPEDNARSAQLFLIAVGVPMLLLAAVIEERRKAKEALQTSERAADKIFRSSPDPIVIVRRADGAILDVNERWEALFGYSRAEAVGRSTSDFNVVDDERDRQGLVNLTEARGNVRDVSITVRDRAGRARNAMLTTEIVDFGGESRIIAILRDVTEQRRAEREASEQRQQLAHLGRVAMLGELSGALAHELNQPLTAILSNAQAGQLSLAGDNFDLDELREILRDIADQDLRAGEVIARLRRMLKKEEAQFQSLDMGRLVHEVLELAHSDLIARNIEIDTRLPPDLPCVHGDRIQLQQVLLNLILNACEAMSAKESIGRKLTIGGQCAADGSVELSIADRGPKVGQEGMERVFEPFFTTKEQGLGLGLSISRGIVAAHSGRIWAIANPDGGATFHVMLPADMGAES